MRKAKKDNLKRKVDFVSRNRKVAKNRGEKWKENLKAAKMESSVDPLTKIRLRRVDLNLTQEGFGNAVGLKKSAYRRIEIGGGAEKKIAKAICSKLRRSVGELFNKNDDDGKYYPVRV